MTKVDIDEVKERLNRGDGITVVDSRSAAAWSDSDIKAAGAIRVPPDDVEEHISGMSRDDYIVTY